jgi:hypothetical protein
MPAEANLVCWHGNNGVAVHSLTACRMQRLHTPESASRVAIRTLCTGHLAAQSKAHTSPHKSSGTNTSLTALSAATCSELS